MTELIYLPLARLKRHPENMRRYYPDVAVAEMAASIRAVGVLQALLVIPIAGSDCYHVVDGNLRLAAACQLGDACPPLKCEQIDADHAHQLLVMAATSLQYPKDEISEALHYRRLIEQEGYTVIDIVAATGVARYRIDKCLQLLHLDEEIQQLIAEKRLSSNPAVVRALLAVPDRKLRLKLARRFAANGTSQKHILRGCQQVTARAVALDALDPAQTAAVKKRQTKILNYSTARQKTLAQPPHRFSPEAAALIWDIAGKTLCDDCKLDGLGQQCYLCPGPQEFIEHLVELAETQVELAEPIEAEDREKSA